MIKTIQEYCLVFFPKASSMLGFSFSFFNRVGRRAGLNGAVRTVWAQGKGRERKGKEGKGRERKEKEGKGRERMGKEGKGKEGKGSERNGNGKERKGMSGKRSRWRSASLAARNAADGRWVGRIARTAADGVGATEWLEMGGAKKPLVMSVAARTAADG